MEVGYGQTLELHVGLSQAGLITLSQSPPEACPQSFECQSSGQQPIAFKQCPATPSCAGDSSYHWSKGQAICPTACGTDETVIERPATCQLVRQTATCVPFSL